MRENPNQYEVENARRRLPAETPFPRQPAELQSIVVRYENRPDRCTITPKECSSGEQLTAWLSADFDAFVDLKELR